MWGSKSEEREKNIVRLLTSCSQRRCITLDGIVVALLMCFYTVFCCWCIAKYLLRVAGYALDLAFLYSQYSMDEQRAIFDILFLCTVPFFPYLCLRIARARSKVPTFVEKYNLVIPDSVRSKLTYSTTLSALTREWKISLSGFAIMILALAIIPLRDNEIGHLDCLKESGANELSRFSAETNATLLDFLATSTPLKDLVGVLCMICAIGLLSLITSVSVRCDEYTFSYRRKFHFLCFFTKKYSIPWENIHSANMNTGIITLTSGEEIHCTLYGINQDIDWVQYIVDTLISCAEQQEREKFLIFLTYPESRNNWLDHKPWPYPFIDENPTPGNITFATTIEHLQ